jgi:hypothetical protein
VPAGRSPSARSWPLVASGIRRKKLDGLFDGDGPSGTDTAEASPTINPDFIAPPFSDHHDQMIAGVRLVARAIPWMRAADIRLGP